MNFKDKKVLVMGLGLHGGGVSVAKWLVRAGAKVTITDIKTKKELQPSLDKLKNFPIKYVLGRHREADFKSTDFVIQNPGVPRESNYLKIAKKYGAEIYNEASLFFDLIDREQIIGITGTRGKSTTTALLYEILRKKFPKILFGGNIRINTMFDIVDKIKDNKVILELSSWQLEGLEKSKKSPHISAITNIMPDHLNRYKDIYDYIDAKENIFRYEIFNDFSVFNKDNKFTGKMGKNTPSKRYWVSLKYFKEDNGAFINDGWIFFRENGKDKRIMKASAVGLLGEHNLYNILFAVVIAMILKAGINNIKSAVKNFKGLSDRLELVKIAGGVKYYNDTTSTTPEACIVALKTLGKKKRKNIILIAGGDDKKLNFKNLAKIIKKYCKEVVLLEGTATKKLKKELKLINFAKELKIFNSMDVAVIRAKNLAEKGNIILLSPAAASFGIFKNEFDRGELFKKHILI